MRRAPVIMMRRMYADEWIEINGVRLHYQEWGPRDAAPVLLLHGLTQQSHTFDGVARRLSARYRCLALDVRGRGESDWASGETYTIPQYVDDVLKFLTALGLPALHLFGTSMGGLISLSLAAIVPDVLLSLGLNDIGPEIDPRGATRVARYAAEIPECFPTFDATLGWALEQYPWLAEMGRDDVARWLRWAVRERPDGGWRFKCDPAIGRAPRPTPEVAEAARRLWWDAFSRLRCPILLVRGAASDILSLETADAMQRRQPRMLRVDVPRVGHAPILEEPAAVAALERFYGLRG